VYFSGGDARAEGGQGPEDAGPAIAIVTSSFQSHRSSSSAYGIEDQSATFRYGEFGDRIASALDSQPHRDVRAQAQGDLDDRAARRSAWAIPRFGAARDVEQGLVDSVGPRLVWEEDREMYDGEDLAPVRVSASIKSTPRAAAVSGPPV
jgi:hypothetical protein